MPHVIIKMFPGRTDEQKERITKGITDTITRIAGCEEDSVSIAVEEVSSQEWAEKVYKPDIMEKEETPIKKPGYNPFKHK